VIPTAAMSSASAAAAARDRFDNTASFEHLTARRHSFSLSFEWD